MASSVIENLVTQLSFDFDEGKLEKFDDLVEDAAKGLAVLVASATAAAVAVFTFTKSIAESNDKLGKFAIRTGISVASLQELGFVAELNGGSIDSMNSSLENLSRIASEASRGMGPGIEAFGILGISVTDSTGRLKDADTLLLDVADSIARLGTQAERLEFAQKLGIGGDLLIAIQQGSAAIEEQRKEARELGFILDENATTSAANFNDEMLRISKIVSGVASSIGTRLMKEINPMMKAFVNWFKVNKKIIQQNVTGFIEKLSKSIRIVVNIANRVIARVNSVVSAMGGWKAAIIATTGVLLIMNASALLMPILAVAAGVGILLILEDIIVFANGGDSAIGNLAKKFPILDTALQGTLSILAMIVEGWRLIFTEGDTALEGLIMMVQDLANAFPLIGKAIDFIIASLGVLFDKFSKLFMMAVEGWKLLFTDGAEAFEGLKMLVNDLIDNFNPLIEIIKSITVVIMAIPDAFDIMVERGKSAIKSLTGSIMGFSKSIKSFIIDPLSSVKGLINKIPGIDIGGDVDEPTEAPEQEGNRNNFIDNIEPAMSSITESTTNVVENNQPLLYGIGPTLEKMIVPIEKSIEPIEKFIVPIEKSIDPLEKMIVPIEKSIEPIEKFIVPIEKSIDPIKEIVSPGIEITPPIIDLSDPMIENILPSIGESQNRETNISRLATSNTSTNNTNNVNNDNRVSNKPEVTININGGDLDSVKRTVNDVMNEQYSAAQTILDSEVEF